MKNSKLIIKIAVIISAVASVFSIVTLIRAVIIKANMVLPIIQVVGSAAIFAVCFIMFRALPDTDEEEEADNEEDVTDDGEKPADEGKSDRGTRKNRPNRKDRKKEDRENAASDTAEDIAVDNDKAEEAVDELFEKYHLSDFEEKE